MQYATLNKSLKIKVEAMFNDEEWSSSPDRLRNGSYIIIGSGCKSTTATGKGLMVVIVEVQ
jgi:hypothetical protein